MIFLGKVGPHSSLDLDWHSFISAHPDIAFLFFVSEEDSSKIVEHLEDVGFHHPVIHDPDRLFFKHNLETGERLTFISFLVKEKKVAGLGNPSIPTFGESLDHLKNMPNPN